MTEPQEVTLVTGATGLVGSALCRRLAGQGRRARALVQTTSDASFLDELGVELTVGDVAEEADCRRAMEGAGRVFHCAAYVSDWAEAEEMIRINVEGLQAMMPGRVGPRGDNGRHLQPDQGHGRGYGL
jgi:nucleoside-diphosphate-sugar epimerase